MCFLDFEGAQVGEAGRTCVMCVQGPHRSVSMKPLTSTGQLACSGVFGAVGVCRLTTVDPFSAVDLRGTGDLGRWRAEDFGTVVAGSF